MDLGWTIRFIIFGILHWVLAGMLLQDLAYRKKVLGGKKWPWAVVIIFVTWLGSIVYLLCHPQIFTQGDRDRD